MEIKGLLIYNYNNREFLDYGVKTLLVFVDKLLVTPKVMKYSQEKTGFLIRKAPGDDIVDFGQFIPFEHQKIEKSKATSPKKCKQMSNSEIRVLIGFLSRMVI